MHDQAGAPGGGFDAALRDWANRPPETSPGAAAARVRARLSRSRPAHAKALLLSVAASVVAAVVAGIGLRTLWSPPGIWLRDAARKTETALPPLPANVMVFWLDRDTPVYFVTAANGSQETRP